MKFVLWTVVTMMSVSCGQHTVLPDSPPKWLLQGSGTSGKTAPLNPVMLTPSAQQAGIDLHGRVAGDGAQAYTDWLVVAIGRDSGEARVGAIDASGAYTLPNVAVGEAQTLALFNSDYLLAAVLSLESPVPNTIRQYFIAKTSELPPLLNRGPTVSFQHDNGIEIQRDLASDQNGDGIPDGSVSVRGTAFLAAGSGRHDSNQDIDVDHVANEVDPDIDGDGVANVLDPDDDGDGELDVFDPDANSDSVEDNAIGQEDADGWFDDGLRFAAAELIVEQTSEGAAQTTLNLRAGLQPNAQPPLAVQIMGSPWLFNNSSYKSIAADGTTLTTAFNHTLERDMTGDYVQRVILDAAKMPRAHEALFVQLVYGTAEQPQYREFPLVFPEMKPQMISAHYDQTTHAVLLAGNPFGESQGFTWTAQILAAGQVVWQSLAVPGTTRTLNLPHYGDSVRLSAHVGKYAGPSYTVIAPAVSLAP